MTSLLNALFGLSKKPDTIESYFSKEQLHALDWEAEMSTRAYQRVHLSASYGRIKKTILDRLLATHCEDPDFSMYQLMQNYQKSLDIQNGAGFEEKYIHLKAQKEECRQRLGIRGQGLKR